MQINKKSLANNVTEAALAWSFLREGKDAMAQILLTVLGLEESYNWVLENSDKAVIDYREILGWLEERGITFNLPLNKQVEAVRRSLERWKLRLEKLDLPELLKQLEKHSIGLLHCEDKNWPQAFRQLEIPPPVLFFRGNSEVLEGQENRVAMVGTRIPDYCGREVALDLGAQVGEAGYSTISGGAYGIDTIVHQASLGVGQPTISVQAGGLDHLYPGQNRSLFHKIIEKGLIISQYPPGVAPARWRFLSRNRIIAAFASATVVIQAASRSGALNTAKHARELGKPLGVVPGDIRSPLWVGSHRLIREGATLISSAKDIFEIVQPLYLEQEEGTLVDDLIWGENEKRALNAIIPRQGSRLKEIAVEIGLSVSETSIALSKLEMLGKVSRKEELFFRN